MKDTTKKVIDSLAYCKSKVDTLLINSTYSSSKDSSNIGSWITLEDITKIISAASVPLLIFTLTQFISWLKSKLEKRREVISYRNIITTWVTLIEKPVSQQITSGKEFAAKLKDSEEIVPIGYRYTRIQLDKIKSISIDRYINSFVINSTGNKEKNYKNTYNLINHFNYIDNVEAEILKSYADYRTEILGILKEWNDSFNSLDSMINRQTISVNTSHNHPTALFHEEVIKITDDWYNKSSGKSTATFAISDLITPLSEIVKKELANNPSNDYAFNLLVCLKQFGIINRKWNKIKEGNLKLFNELTDKLEGAYGELKVVRDYFLVKTRTRYFWGIK